MLASDGLFEVMNPTEVCAHAHAAAAGKGHPALSAPRPPAIPLHSTPPSAAQQARQLLLLAAQPLTRAASTVAQALSSLFDIALLQGGFLPWQSPAEPPGLSACCDCCGRKACDRQAAIAARRARTITARAHHQRTAAASCEAPSTPAKVAPMAEAVAWRLIQEAFNRGSMDNLAVVVVDLTTLSRDADGWGSIPLAMAASESQQRLWVSRALSQRQTTLCVRLSASFAAQFVGDADAGSMLSSAVLFFRCAAPRHRSAEHLLTLHCVRLPSHWLKPQPLATLCTL